jgi:hypothetical protein
MVHANWWEVPDRCIILPLGTRWKDFAAILGILTRVARKSRRESGQFNWVTRHPESVPACDCGRLWMVRENAAENPAWGGGLATRAVLAGAKKCGKVSGFAE